MKIVMRIKEKGTCPVSVSHAEPTPASHPFSPMLQDSALRVDLKNPVYGDQVYTEQPGGCGEPGTYIHLTPAYLTNPLAEETWGPRGAWGI